VVRWREAFPHEERCDETHARKIRHEERRSRGYRQGAGHNQMGCLPVTLRVPLRVSGGSFFHLGTHCLQIIAGGNDGEKQQNDAGDQEQIAP
jgi:hypothetical protein